MEIESFQSPSSKQKKITKPQNVRVNNAKSYETEEPKSYNILLKVLTILTIVGGVVFIALSTTPADPSYKRLQMVKLGRGGYKYSLLRDDEVQVLFQDFMVNFNKEYSTDEELSTRYQNFVSFLSTIDDRNAAEEANGGSGVHGITKFADRTTNEINKLLKAKSSSKSKAKRVSVDTSDVDDSDEFTVNWAGIYTTGIKDQGYCGSCWAFSGVSQIESDSIIAGILNTTETLSTQQVISCDTDDGVEGCDGGWLYATFDYAESNSIVSDSSYPYTSYWDDTGECSDSLSSLTKLVSVTDYYVLSTEKAMKSYVKTTGPLAVCLDASNWASYEKGVLSVCGTDIDHCVQAVGISINSDESYWVVRNSWGTDWGLEGYIYLKYGEDICDIDNEPTYSSVTAA